MNYKHVELNFTQHSKKTGDPCGDVIMYERNTAYTIVVVSDGLGSGVKANISATMTCSRVLELIRRGFSIYDAFKSVVSTMHEAKQKDLPYAVFTVAHILNDGVATVLSYEMPPPVFIANKYASLLNQRSFTLGGEVVYEYECFFNEGNALVLVSDGVTQAGMGITLKLGLTIEGYCQFINKCLKLGSSYSDILFNSICEVASAGKNRFGDDTSVALISCRSGNVLNVFTGPPVDPSSDIKTVKKFIDSDGIKVICGSSTANIVARYLGKKLGVENKNLSNIEPPKYELEGIDLVTEGAITLNQVYNIIDEDTETFKSNTGVCTLHSLFAFADRINFIVGAMKNDAHKDPVFMQLGVLARTAIVPLIAEKLRKKGKMVVVEYV